MNMHSTAQRNWSSQTRSIVAALEADLGGRQAWDEPPVLYTIIESKGAIELRLFPGDQSVFCSPRPPVVLRELAARATQLTEVFQYACPEGLIGVAFLYEAWLVTYRSTAEREADKGLPPREHPRRVENRLIQAVNRHGVRFYSSQARGGDVTTSVADRLGGPVFTGLITESLDTLLGALLGVKVPKQATQM